jgi:hypothetical protein
VPLTLMRTYVRVIRRADAKTAKSAEGAAPARVGGADQGDLDFIRAHAAALGPINLPDALRICLMVRDQEPARYEAASGPVAGSLRAGGPRRDARGSPARRGGSRPVAGGS